MSLDTDQWLAAARVDPAVSQLRPDYRALLILADGLTPGPSDAASEQYLRAAELAATSGRPPTETQTAAHVEPHVEAHVAAWREAFRQFGAKPQRTRPSVDALLRRAAAGLPRIDRLTDVYNAVSVAHAVPVGGEDIDHYQGALQLVRAAGDEPFDTVVGGEAAVEHPDPGEVIWRDDAGVTCRRWNWRQCVRTRLTTVTTRAVFILDALAPMTDDELATAGEALTTALRTTNPGVRLVSRLVPPG